MSSSVINKIDKQKTIMLPDVAIVHLMIATSYA